MKKIVGLVCVSGLAITFLAFNRNGSNQRVTEYTVVESGSLNSFNTLVNQRLNDGWKLAGGVGFSSKGYIQALQK